MKLRSDCEARILESVKIKCKKCGGKMIRATWADSNEAYNRHVDPGSWLIGYSCEDCPHYHVLNRCECSG